MLDIFSHYPVSEKYLNCHQVRVEPRLACRGSLPYITHQALECFWVVLVRAHRTVPKVVFKLKKYLLKFLHTLHLSIPDQMKTKYRYRIQFIKKNPPSRLASSPFTPTKSSLSRCGCLVVAWSVSLPLAEQPVPGSNLGLGLPHSAVWGAADRNVIL